ncbi:hypothetical protein [Ruminobacter sp.]|uniref:hypothetical protein n=1 Tax=Ruminobacter sp. TaxID=2774296 RepID=UPI003866181C
MKTWDAIYQFGATVDGNLETRCMGLLVRCKDCKFYTKGHTKGYCYYDDDCYVWYDNDFCSRAERKEE